LAAELKQLDFALKALEKAAGYDEQLKNPKAQLTPEDTEAHGKLGSEYFVLRTMLVTHSDLILTLTLLS
jgi:hypothetical protein